MIAGQQPLDWGFAETLAYATLLTEGLRNSHHRPGQRSRHVLPSACGVARPEAKGEGFIPARKSLAESAALHRHRFAAVGRSRDGLRVRFLDDRTELSDDLGRPVRRLRERRAGHHRPVHQLGRSEMGPAVRAHAVPAARLRRAGTGAFIRASRALPAVVRRAEHAGLSCRRRLRRCSTCCGGRCSKPFRKPLIVMTPKSLLRHKLSVSPLEDLTRGSFRNVIDEIDDIQPAKRHARRVLLRQGVFRSARFASRRRSAQRRDRACRAAVSVPDRGVRGCHSQVLATRAKSSGARRNRRIRAAGIRSAIACRSRCRRIISCCTRAARRQRRRQPASSQMHAEQQQASSTQRCARPAPKNHCGRRHV